MTEIERRKRWNASLGNTTAMRMLSPTARSYVNNTMQRNLWAITELEEMAKPTIFPEAPKMFVLDSWINRLRQTMNGG